MSAPQVSVVIPTWSRPGPLQRAVRSALDGADGDVEVVVVPNGPDRSWRDALAAFDGDARVRAVECAEANANVARNAGLAAARGAYVRFLDDDDWLLPEGTRELHELAARERPDVCSGAVRILSGAGERPSGLVLQRGGDLVATALAERDVAQPSAHLWRRGALDGVAWDPALPWLQDQHFVHAACRARDLSWATTATPVSVWHHHDDARTTDRARREPHRVPRAMRDILMDTVGALEASGRLDAPRRRAAARGLWACIHEGFPFEPRHWAAVAAAARALDPDSRYYANAAARPFDPVLLEWLLLPKRRLNRWWRGRIGNRIR